jgi:hypothetical protein
MMRLSCYCIDIRKSKCICLMPPREVCARPMIACTHQSILMFFATFYGRINEFYRKQDTMDSREAKLELEDRVIEQKSENSSFRRDLAQTLSQLWNEHHYLHRGYPWLCITRSRLHLVLKDAFGSLPLGFVNTMLKDLYAVHFCSLPKEQPRYLRSGIAISQPSGTSISPGTRYFLLKRHEDVEVCPVGSLAFYLHAVWTVSTQMIFSARTEHVPPLLWKLTYQSVFSSFSLFRLLPRLTFGQMAGRRVSCYLPLLSTHLESSTAWKRTSVLRSLL